jgi:putative PIN family toxin of toxin-antitoxin system
MFPDRPRVIIDTGVMVSRILRPDPVPAQAVALAERKTALIVSEETLAELIAVLTRPKFAKFVDMTDVKDIVEAYAGLAEIVPVSAHVTVCRDPDDNKFLALAMTAGADMIVTGDDDLLALHRFEQTKIITPRDFFAGFQERPLP